MTQDTTQQPEILVGRYALTRMLGRGAMGVVFEGHDLQLGRIVAVKALSRDLCSNEEAVRVFEEEGRVMAQLNHPNVLAVYDVVRQDNRAYLVMEFINGIDIDQAVEQSGPLSVADGVDIAAQLLVALNYLQSQGIVHRDIKPSNMMLSRDGVLKLMDFGLARDLSVILQKGTAIRGTPAYMSPEQVLGEPLSHQSDLYCVGTSLFEMFTGRLPFTEGELAFHQVFSEPPKPSDLREDLPKAIEDVIRSCMAKKPADRPKRAEDVLRSLVDNFEHTRPWPPSVRAFLGGSTFGEDDGWQRMDLSSIIELPKQTAPHPDASSLLQLSESSAPTPDNPTPPPPPIESPSSYQRKWIPLLLGFSIVLIAGLALLVFLLQTPNTPPAPNAALQTAPPSNPSLPEAIQDNSETAPSSTAPKPPAEPTPTNTAERVEPSEPSEPSEPTPSVGQNPSEPPEPAKTVEADPQPTNTKPTPKPTPKKPTVVRNTPTQPPKTQPKKAAPPVAKTTPTAETPKPTTQPKTSPETPTKENTTTQTSPPAVLTQTQPPTTPTKPKDPPTDTKKDDPKKAKPTPTKETKKTPDPPAKKSEPVVPYGF